PAFYRLAAVLAAADGGVDFGRELGRDARVYADPGLLVLDALQRTAGADLLDERAGVIGQRRLHMLPARRRRLAEPSAQRVEAVALRRRGEHGGGELGLERLTEGGALLAAKTVRLVENEEPRPRREVERLQRLVDHAHVLVQVRVRDV